MASQITVVPASTKIGKETIRLLLASREKPSIRGIFRDTTKALAEYTNHPNFKAVKGDIASGGTLDFGNSDAVLYVPPPTYEGMDQSDWAKQAATNVKDALKKAGVKRLVIISGLGSQHDHGIGFVRLNHHTDQILRDSAPEVTILQCTHFQEEFEYMFQIPLGEPPTISPWIAPKDYRIPMVSIKDIGETCTKCLLTKPEKASPQVFKLFGPRPYSSEDMRDVFEEVTGKKVELEISQGEDLKSFLGMLFPEHCLPDFLEMLESSLPGGLISKEYEYDEKTITGKVDLMDVFRNKPLWEVDMSTRRSTRLRAKEVPEPAVVPIDQEPTETTKATKRKALADGHEKPAPKSKESKIVTKAAEKPAAKKEKTAAGVRKTGKAKAPAKTPMSSSSDPLLSLPREILNLILDSIDDTMTLGRLSKTSKSYHALVGPRLYKRLSVSVSYHAHIAKLIRTIEPLLSIAQRKQLRKEGQYKGQQETFSDKLDPHKKPEKAEFVRQAILAIGDPGKKHRFIVHRYAEEALKNINNVEVVETWILTESIAKSLAAQKKLQALKLYAADNLFDRYAKPLATIKNLKHLFIHLPGYRGEYMDEDNVPLALILNSRSTLRSLTIEMGSFQSEFLEYWEKMANSKSSKHDLTALESFRLTGASIGDGLVKALKKAIDFVALKELKFGYLSDNVKLLFDHLCDVFSKAHKNNTKINLGNLSLNMGTDALMSTPGEQQAIVDSKIDFISSFDTLTSLTLDDYGQYSEDITVNPDLKNSLLQAILKHENLTKLKISYRGIVSGYRNTCLEPVTVAALINGLPKLTEFEFLPQSTKLEEIGKMVARGHELTAVTLVTGGSWSTPEENYEASTKFLRSVAHEVLERDLSTSSVSFKWEDHSKITRVAADWIVWEIGSKLTKSKRGMKKAEKFTVTVGKQKREVLYRDITDYVREPFSYAADCRWVKKVEQDLN
ncbi:hypothetical protein F53441_12516 [Fusarium austroafricanum]|uniref:F-box domain-containing protein n=1 Tax=Fusarium austroafricanum TaxID=2364996 RepID=A0A8H4JVB3_9HYPO|nr:hypothetical protein F53441_12516 [Fusarium austroafricanum]